jgi:hypothetical protein
MKDSPTKYHLKPLIIAILDEQGKSRFVGFANELEATLEPVIEAAVRKKIAGALKRITRKALTTENPPTPKETQ